MRFRRLEQSAGLALGTALAFLAACGGNGPAVPGQSSGTDARGEVQPAVQLDGWSMPDLPGVVPPEPANLRDVRARLAPFEVPEDALVREASGVIKTLPDDTLMVSGSYPSPGFFDFRVSTPFNAAAPAQLFVNGTLSLTSPLSSPLAGRYVQVGLVTNAIYNYALDPDGNPLTDDAKPEYLFNQSALMLLANDMAGNAFAAPFDYNSKSGIGTAQTVPAGALSFSLRLTPDVLGGGQAALQINGGAFGPNFAYKKNNWGWWPDEDYSNARLIVMSYSYNADPAPLNVGFSGVVADDPAYVAPGVGGVGVRQIDATALPNAKFSVWNPVGPTPYTGSVSTNTVFDASTTLYDGDQFYLQFELDPALAPNDLVLYPQRVGGSGVVTVTPAGYTLGGTLGTWFDVPVGTRTLRLKPGGFNRITNDMKAGLPWAQYVLRDAGTLATIGGPYLTDESNIKKVVLAAGVDFQPVFSSYAYATAGSNPATNGNPADTIYPGEWPANWFSVGLGSVGENGSAVFPSMRDYFTQAGLVNTMDSDAFIRCELDSNRSFSTSTFYTLQLSPSFTDISAILDPSANPLNTVVLGKFLSLRARDIFNNTTGLFTTDANRKLSGANSAALTFSGAGGTLGLTVLPVRVADDTSQPNPDATITGLGPWGVTLNFLLQYGTAPYTVEFDADYGSAWNDGIAGRVYSVTGSPYAAGGLVSGTASLTNHSPGAYTAALRVTDSAGAQYVYVYPAQIALPASGWTPSLPKPDSALDDRGWYSSMAIINGNPAIAYHDFTNEDLMYTRALDPGGANWGDPMLIAGSGSDTGWLPSLTTINGRPAISYVPVGGGDVIFRRASDANGASWPVSGVIALTGQTFLSSSLVAVNGNPAIAAWGDAGSGNVTVRYVRASDAAGTTWGANLNLGSSSAYIPGPIPQVSMAIVNGNPAIAYHHNGDARYRRASDVDGTAWSASLAADNGGGVANVGALPSLAVVNGNPAIAHYDYSNGNLRFVRAVNVDGTAWGSPQILESVGDTGLFPSLEVINGLPAVSYWNQTNDDLMYIQAADASGAVWAGAGTVVDADQCGDWSTLLLVNGQPGIGYYTANGGDLRFIRFY